MSQVCGKIFWRAASVVCATACGESSVWFAPPENTACPGALAVSPSASSAGRMGCFRASSGTRRTARKTCCTPLQRTASHYCGWLLGLLAAVVLCGCPAAENDATRPQPDDSKPRPAAAQPADQEPAAAQPMGQDEEESRKPIDLGEPLVDNLKSLIKLDPIASVWIDRQHKQVVLLAQVCRADYPLEFFATYPDRGYESVVVTDVRPSTVHAGLLAIGAKPGQPVQFEPEFAPPTGTPIAIEVRWKDQAGKRHSAPAQQWVRNIQTKQALDVDWVFVGSGFWQDEQTGQKRYMADGGDFISVLNLPSATLDLPIRSYSSLEARSFEGFVEHLPPQGTPVTIILTPNLPPAEKAEQRP